MTVTNAKRYSIEQLEALATMLPDDIEEALQNPISMKDLEFVDFYVNERGQITANYQFIDTTEVEGPGQTPVHCYVTIGDDGKFNVEF